MLALLGIVMIYSWIHAAIIVFKNNVERTAYESVVLVTAFVFFALFVIGTMTE